MVIPSFIYNRVLAEFSKTISSEYGMTNSNFSTTDSLNKNAIFPFVYIHLLPGTEEGETLEGQTVNGGLFTFQIDVYDNQSASRARTIMGEIVRIMKEMQFSIVAMPEFEYADTHRCTARFRRVIGNVDVI